jgi:hypothetical protein
LLHFIVSSATEGGSVVLTRGTTTSNKQQAARGWTWTNVERSALARSEANDMIIVVE